MGSLLVFEDALEQIAGDTDVEGVAAAGNDISAIDSLIHGEEFSANDSRKQSDAPTALFCSTEICGCILPASYYHGKEDSKAGGVMGRLKLSLVLVGVLVFAGLAQAEKRFGREVIKVADPQSYSMFRLDDVTIPSMLQKGISVSSLVYRGTEYYYVEVGISNKTDHEIVVTPDFISFVKPNYTVMRTDTLAVANQLASAENVRFVPVPPPQVQPSSTTTYNATATSYGNQTQISGTATTTPDYSGQAGANLGNALGNAIAARRFYKARSEAVNLARFLHTFAQGADPAVIQPGQTRVVACTFAQLKQKKAPFEVTIRLGEQEFDFKYKE